MKSFTHFYMMVVGFLFFGLLGEAHADDGVGDQPTSFKNASTTYDLWCDPRGDLCSFTDDEGVKYKLSREYLPQYIPLAEDTNDCFQEVCYDDNMDVIGLNPNYHLFD